jgi:GNAT superfamily N-acetyltransferase
MQDVAHRADGPCANQRGRFVDDRQRGMPSVMVRRAVDTETEARSLTQVHIDAWKWAYRGLLPESYLDNLDDQHEARLEVWRRLLSQDPARSAVWVAIEDGEIVGFACTGPSRDGNASPGEAELLSIYLLERVVGTGIGRLLMSRAISELRNQGYNSAVLWVLESNDRARRFYERGGWALDGGRQVDSRPGFDLVEVRYRIDL